MKRSLLPIAISAFLMTGCMTEEPGGNRGIGVYPGNPAEDFSPEMVKDDTYRNIALNRAAYSSPSHDYCLTAQLITDGIIETEMPVYLDLSTPEGPVVRREREWLLDQGLYTIQSFQGSDTYILFELKGGWKMRVDNVKMLGFVTYLEDLADGSHEICFYGSEDGREWDRLGEMKGTEFIGRAVSPRRHSDPDKSAALGDRLLPRRLFEADIDLASDKEYSMIKAELKMPGAQEWLLSYCDFFNSGEMADLISSRFFCSTWMSLDNTHGWVYVDLGTKAKFDKIVLNWLNRPSKGRILVSDDARKWRLLAEMEEGEATDRTDVIKVRGRGRYVKVEMENDIEGSNILLSEMEVWGTGGLKAEAKPAPDPDARSMTISGGGWELKRAAEISAKGEEISTGDYDTSGWLIATVPGTVLTSYVNIGAVPDPNYADNIFNISDSYFNSDFWYRTEFDVPDHLNGRKLFLEFDGINWKAQVYLNGKPLGNIDGGFIRGRFDITECTVEGKNTLAVRIIKNAHIGAVKEKNEKNTGINGGILGADNPTFHASIGWDWISTVRGRNIGIWNDVRIVSEGTVSLKDPYISTSLPLPDTTSAIITPEVYVRNSSPKEVCGRLKGHFGDIRFEQEVVLAAGEERVVRFDVLSYPQLMLRNPALWWPNGYGEQNLYDSGFVFETDGEISDEISFKAGIRDIDTDEDGGILHIYVNGRRFIGRGGNWGFSESNLNYRAREYDIAAAYHADMNFTIMRNWVGQTGDAELYEACDRHGIMVWQDFWLANPSDGPDPSDPEMFLANAEDYLRQHRSHPSLVIYCGRNEGFPPEQIDNGLRALVKEYHPELHYISSSADGCVSGHGPYRALTPVEYFRYPTGNDRFHSERGMPAVMTYESMLRTYSPDALWPQNRQWGQHDFTLDGAQAGASFNALIADGYGEPQSAKEFSELGQFINYDGYRAMFESRSQYRKGLLLWMSHPAWPSMTWQTYDWYFEPTAAYFGCKKACEPLHIQWNPADSFVETVNYSAGQNDCLTAKAVVMNTDGTIVWEKENSFDSAEDSTVKCFAVEIPDNADDTHFIKLYLTDSKGTILSENFYINGREYGNHQTMRDIARAQVRTDFSYRKTEDADGIQGPVWKGTVVLENRSEVPAVMVRLNVVGSKDGGQILPMFYEDNYFSLMPGERKTVSLKWFDADLRGNRPEVVVTGYNL